LKKYRFFDRVPPLGLTCPSEGLPRKDQIELKKVEKMHFLWIFPKFLVGGLTI